MTIPALSMRLKATRKLPTETPGRLCIQTRSHDMILVPLLNLTFRRLPSISLSRGAWRIRIGGSLRQVRYKLLPTDAERNRRYLEEACDRYDLEHRIRELDRVRQPARGPFHPFGDR